MSIYRSDGKIGGLQLAFALLMCRIFTECCVFPFAAESFGVQRMAAVITAQIILAVLLMPIMLICKRNGESFLTMSLRRSRGFGAVLGAVYVLLLGYSAVLSAVQGGHYAINTVMDGSSVLPVLLLLLAVCLYGAYRGSEALARSGAVIAVLFIVLLFLVVIGTFTKTDYVNGFSTEFGGFFSGVMNELAKSGDLLLLAVFTERVRRGAARSVWLYLLISAVALEVLALLYAVVLGSTAGISEFSFGSLASLSDIVLFRRLDGLDAIVFLLAAMLRISLCICAIRIIIARLISERAGKISVFAATAAVFVLSALLSLNKPLVVFLSSLGGAVILIGAIIPLIALIFGERRGGNAAR